MKHLVLLVFGIFIVSCNNDKIADKQDKLPRDQSANISTARIISTYDALEESLKSSGDTTVIVNFWATWCVPCVKELPFFSKAAEELKFEKIKFIFVSMDFLNKIDSNLKPFLAKNKLPGEVVVLADQNIQNWGDRIDPQWDGAIPITFVKTGEQIRSHSSSFDDTNQLISFIKNKK